MAVDITTTIIGIFSIIGSVVASYLSYIIYKYNRLAKAWLAVTAAFVLIIFRRGLGFVTEFGFLPEARSTLKFIEGILLLVISVLYIWGFWSMKKNFEKFEVVEKRAKEKIELFIRSKRSKANYRK